MFFRVPRGTLLAIGGLIIGCLLGFLLRGLTSTRTGATAQDELHQVDEYLKAGAFQQAHDALLAAMRVAPGDEKVFERSLEFIRKVNNDTNEETMPLAQDIHQRAANLIPFLPLARLRGAREAHTKVAEELYPGKPAADPEDSFAEVAKLLEAAQQGDLPNFARARFLHEVEAELGSQARRVVATAMKPQETEASWKRWNKLKDNFDNAQKKFLAALYQDECKPRITAWRKKVDHFCTHKASVSLDQIHQANKEILALIVEGQRVARDLAPYLEGGVDIAVDDDKEDGTDKHLARLARLREWNYNRWSLDRIEKVEQSDDSAIKKLQSLAAIDETRLASYVGQRYAEVWKKFFDGCSKDDKVVATKLRILREYQQ